MGKRISLVGRRFGKQVVVRELGRGRVEIRCDCGNIKATPKQYLLNGHSRSCGCGRYADRLPPINQGDRFTLLVVIEKLGSSGGRRQVLVRCDCTAFKVVTEDLLRNGHAKSCGCLRRRIAAGRNRTHGEAGKFKTVLYETWQAMWERVKYLPKYQKRGIHPGWRDYITFRDYINEHLGPRPPKHSFDRIDNSKGYEPGNVRWATAKTQVRNRSSNHIITLDGVSRCVAEWAELSGVSSAVVYGRLKRGWSERDAVTAPVHKVMCEVTVDGRARTIDEWAKVSKVPKVTIYKRLREGWPPELAVTAPRWHRYQQKPKK